MMYVALPVIAKPCVQWPGTEVLCVLVVEAWFHVLAQLEECFTVGYVGASPCVSRENRIHHAIRSEAVLRYLIHALLP